MSFFVSGECRKTKAKKAVNEHQSLYHLWLMKIRSTGFKPMKARITRLRSFGYNNTELILLPNQKIGQQSVHVGSALTMKTKFMHAPRAYILTLTYSLIQPKAIWVLCWQCNTHRNDSVLKVNLDMVFRDSLHHRLKNVVTRVRKWRLTWRTIAPVYFTAKAPPITIPP